MFKGDITITTDTNLAINLTYNPTYKVMALMDDAKPIFGDLPVHALAPLLPPYIANEAENMGDISSFWELYWKHLATPDAESYISILLFALYKGYNILLYVNPDEESLTFIDAFLKFVQDFYGVTIGTKDRPCSFDLNYEDIVRIRMFKYGYLPVKDLIDNIHNKIMDPQICYLIVDALNMQPDADVVDQVDRFISQYRMNQQPQEPKKLIDPPWTIKIV